jgi:GTP cyclohydrolase I
MRSGARSPMTSTRNLGYIKDKVTSMCAHHLLEITCTIRALKG